MVRRQRTPVREAASKESLDLPRLLPRPARPRPALPIIPSSRLTPPVLEAQAPVVLGRQPHVQVITRTALPVDLVRLRVQADLAPRPDPVDPVDPEVEALAVPVAYAPALLPDHDLKVAAPVVLAVLVLWVLPSSAVAQSLL